MATKLAGSEGHCRCVRHRNGFCMSSFNSKRTLLRLKVD